MPFWTVIYSHAYLPLLALLTVACAFWGDAAVRRASVATLLAMGGLWLVPRDYHGLLWPAIVADGILVAVLLRLSMREPRWWLLAMTALQLVNLLGHLAKALYPKMSTLTYMIMQGSGAYPQLICLSIGLLLAIRTRRSATARSVTDWRGAIMMGTGDKS